MITKTKKNDRKGWLNDRSFRQRNSNNLIALRGGNYIITYLKINTYNKLIKQKGFTRYIIICYSVYTSKRDRATQTK